MHGLVNRSIQCFVCDTYGQDVWQEACRAAGLGFDNFEAMLRYDDLLTRDILAAVCARLDRSADGFLEDMGTYLVSHPGLDAIRRLLRFGGDSFEEFLHSLDDLHDRVQLALPDLEFPCLELKERAAGSYSLTYRWDKKGFGAVVLGVLRAMADDYGALVLLEEVSKSGFDGDRVDFRIELLEPEFAEGRDFALGAHL